MRAIITVVGKDRVGIIAGVCSILAEKNINICDISQNIVEGYFNMMMIVDLAGSAVSFEEAHELLDAVGAKLGMVIRIQHEGIFNSMHRV